MGRSLAQSQRSTTIVRLRLEVLPSDAPAFQVTTAWEVETGSIPRVQAGEEAPVKIGVHDQTMVYLRVGWASYHWTHARHAQEPPR